MPSCLVTEQRNKLQTIPTNKSESVLGCDCCTLPSRMPSWQDIACDGINERFYGIDAITIYNLR
jgi:hypothetical protein